MADADVGVRVTDPNQLEELVAGSGISLDMVREAKVYTCDDPAELARLTGWSRKAFAEDKLPALVFPFYEPGEPDPLLWSVKPRVPMKWRDKGGREHEAKYLRTKKVSPVPPYLPPNLLNERRLFDPSIPKIITEGEKKSLAAASHGFACIGIAGVDVWRAVRGTKKLHPLLREVARRGPEIYLCFDSDRVSNLSVRRAEQQLAQALADAGATVYVIRLPAGPEGAKQGLDDFLVGQGAYAQRETRKLMQAAKEAGPAASPAKDSITPPTVATATTDLGNAERLEKYFGDELRHCPERGGWFVWDGRRWRQDDASVRRMAQEAVRRIYLEAAQSDDRDVGEELVEWAQRSESRRALDAMVSLAEVRETIAAEADAFDAHPFLLNAPNGVVDLKTGKLRPHVRSELHTKVTGAAYDPAARSEAWEQFLHDVTGGDREVQGFLQAAVGYSLTGDTREDKLFFVYGPTRTGKSTFLSTVRAVLGDYARGADFDVFLQDRFAGGGSPKPELVHLVGSRMVVSVEVQDGAQLAEGLVKSLTGGDTMTVRALYRAPFEFRPTFKLWLAANDPPHVRREDEAMWKRILRVPFDVTISRPDPSLKQRLLTEEARRAVLAWAVEGCVRWQKDGLNVPQRVIDSTESYREEMDPTSDFFSLACIFEDGAKVTRKELREEYESVCREVGARPLGARRFAQALRDHLGRFGFDPNDAETRVRGPEKVHHGWKNVRLRRPSDPDAPLGNRKCTQRKTEQSPADTPGGPEGVYTCVQISEKSSPTRGRARAGEEFSQKGSQVYTNGESVHNSEYTPETPEAPSKANGSRADAPSTFNESSDLDGHGFAPSTNTLDDEWEVI